MHELSWAEDLDEAGLDIASDVVALCRQRFDNPPSSAQLQAVALEVRSGQQRMTLRPSLMEFEGVEMPPEVAEKIRALREKWAAAAEEEVVDHDAEWASILAEHRPRMKGACNGTGKLPIEINGQWVCPGCGVPIEPETRDLRLPPLRHDGPQWNRPKRRP